MLTVDTHKLKLLLASHGLNVNELAARANMSVYTIYQLMRNKEQPAQNKTIGQIADAIGVDCKLFLKED